jgi:hypothetical protein
MNQSIIVLLFVIFIFCFINKDKIENFSQLMLPNYTSSIYTGKRGIDKSEISKPDLSRKPSPVEDVKQPPFSRFISNDGSKSDSPEEIKEIKTRLEGLIEKLDILKENNLDINIFTNRGICGEKSKNISEMNFRTPLRPNNEMDKENQAKERHIIAKYAPEDCLWGYEGSGSASEGCGRFLSGSCLNYSTDNMAGSEIPLKTSELIKNCTGYDPMHPLIPIDYSGSTETFNECKRLCCENLFFPMKEEATLTPSEALYKGYLDDVYAKSEANTGLSPYIQSSLTGIYTYISP